MEEARILVQPKPNYVPYETQLSFESVISTSNCAMVSFQESRACLPSRENWMERGVEAITITNFPTVARKIRNDAGQRLQFTSRRVKARHGKFYRVTGSRARPFVQ